ncbi:hypothetical protein ABGB07_02090 [Micromonosporaceae bacterium B7E4]
MSNETVPRTPFRIEERLSNGTVYAAANYQDRERAASGFDGWIRYTVKAADAFGVPNPLAPHGDRHLVLLGPDRRRVQSVVEGPAL